MSAAELPKSTTKELAPAVMPQGLFVEAIRAKWYRLGSSHKSFQQESHDTSSIPEGET
jgi:hypothetical protein